MFHGFVQEETKSHATLKTIILISYDILIAIGFSIFFGIKISNITFGPMLAAIIYTILLILILLITVTKKNLRVLNIYRGIRFLIGSVMGLFGLTFLILYVMFVRMPNLATGFIGKDGALPLFIILIIFGTIHLYTTIRFNKILKEMNMAKDERRSNQSIQLSTSGGDALGVSQITRITELQNSLR